MKKICVLGMGYIGLPTAAMFATHGLTVAGVDVNSKTVEILNSGAIHIEEPGLNTVVQAAVFSGNLKVYTTPQPADAFILAVPTPFEHGNNSEEDGQFTPPKADLTYVRAATRSILPCLQKGNLVILESTSPPQTTVDVVAPILEESGLRIGEDIFLAHCPERVLPGRILEELVTNDRVIGGIDQASAQKAKELYQTFVQGPIFLTDATTAEMVKLMENTYRDVNIALANELAKVAEKLHINVWNAIEMANRHPRVNIHRPGPGVGGHCIAVDPWFIAAVAPESTPLIQTARKVNDAMPHHVVSSVKKAFHGETNAKIACLGLSYKPDVDDIRESPALDVVRLLREAGFQVRTFDPHVPIEAGNKWSQVESLAEATTDVDGLVVLVSHSEFRDLDPQKAPLFAGRFILDTGNSLSPSKWLEKGVTVSVLGYK